MTPEATAHPRLKYSWRPVIDPDDGLFLLSEREQVQLSGSVFGALAALLDGEHGIEEIFAALADEHAPEVVFGALDFLRARGFLAEELAPDAPQEAAFWEQDGVAFDAARRRLADTPVAIRAFGGLAAGRLEALLGAQGVPVRADGGLTVVLTDDYLRPELEDLNARAVETGAPWLLAKPVGVETWLGPAFAPPDTACWACLAHRLRGHRRLETYLAGRHGTRAPWPAPAAALASTHDAALAAVATTVTRWIAGGGRSVVEDRVISHDVRTLEQRHHVLVRRPQCPVCGPRDGVAAAEPLRLTSRPKRWTSDGGHRTGRPQEVVDRLQHHLSPITGVIGQVAPGPRAGTDPLTPTFAADHNFSDMHDERYFLLEGLRRRSGGKGKNATQALASALAESLERYSGVFDGSEPRRRATFASLGSSAVHPNLCMGFSERQYAERASGDLPGLHKARWVPEPFQEDRAIDWTPLWSLTRGTWRQLPTSYCYYGYRSADPCFARADSNGCAAGGAREEAVLQGFLELVERDAVALWWYSRLRRPGVELDSAADGYGMRLREHYRRLERDLQVLDITSDLGVPAFAALSRRVDKAEEDVIYGFGAHLDANVALDRALTEVNQSLEAVPAAGATGDAARYLGSVESVRWWREVRTADHPYLTPDPDVPATRLERFDPVESDDVKTDVETCVKLAADRGIEVLVLDQTRPDVGLPVVRVVAPGLRHFWARFGPGRLYDVPVREGWVDAPLAESALNPYVIQF